LNLGLPRGWQVRLPAVLPARSGWSPARQIGRPRGIRVHRCSSVVATSCFRPKRGLACTTVPLGMGFCLILDVAEPRTAEGLAASIACGAASMRCLGLSKKLEPQINTDEHGCPRSPDLPGRAPTRPAEAWPVASHRW